MKKRFDTLLFFFIISHHGVMAGTNDALPQPVEIARFAGNRAAAITYTFDDGTLGHYTVAAPTLEKYGFRGTFGVVVSRTADNPVAAEKLVATAKKGTHTVTRRLSWQEWREMTAKGHEVCNHGLEHKGLTQLTAEGLEREVEEARHSIASKLGQAPLTFIYPGNARNPKVRAFVLKNHIAARDREQRFGGQGFSIEKANAMVDKAIQNGEFVIVMAHAVAESGYQPITQEQLDGHLKYVSTVKERIWVDTLANVSRYLGERDATKVTIQSSEPDRVTFSLECPLAPEIFNVPLTCVIHVGDPVVPASVTCEQGGVALPVVVAGHKVLVDAVPGRAPVTIRWANKRP